MEKIWLKHYPPGVAAEIDPAQYASLKHLFEAAFHKFPARPAFTNLGRTLSYAEIDELSRRFGAWLQKEAGLGQGRTHRHHDAQPAAVPGRDDRRAAGRPDGGQRQPAVHERASSSTS